MKYCRCENDFDIDLLSGQSSRNNINIIYAVKDDMIKIIITNRL